MRSAQRMFDEVVYLYNKFPEVEEFRMADNISNGKISALIEFCDLMMNSGMNKKVKWSLENAVIRKEMRKPFYEKMRKAGCNFITYGVETPAEHLLEKVGKTLALQKGVDLPAILKEGKQAGIDLTINIMIGLPGETEDNVWKTLKSGGLLMVNISDVYSNEKWSTERCWQEICNPMNNFLSTFNNSEYQGCFGMEMARRPNCKGIGTAKDVEVVEKESDIFAEPVWVWKKK